MKRIIARLLIALGLGLLGLGRRLDRPAPPAAKLTIELPRRQYRPARRRGVSLAWIVPAPVVVFG